MGNTHDLDNDIDDKNTDIIDKSSKTEYLNYKKDKNSKDTKPIKNCLMEKLIQNTCNENLKDGYTKDTEKTTKKDTIAETVDKQNQEKTEASSKISPQKGSSPILNTKKKTESL